VAPGLERVLLVVLLAQPVQLPVLNPIRFCPIRVAPIKDLVAESAET
jgi:hypothetical protein